MKKSLEGLFVVVVKNRLDEKSFIPAELRSAHTLLYPSIQKMICHTQFCSLITFPRLHPTPSSAPEQVSSSFYQTRQFPSSAETPRSLMSLQGGAAISGGDKWKYFQTRNPSQSQCCKRTKEPSDWQFWGWERTHFKGEISFLLLLRFTSFSDISTQSTVTSVCCKGNNGSSSDGLNCPSHKQLSSCFQVAGLESGANCEITVVITTVIIIILC